MKKKILIFLVLAVVLGSWAYAEDDMQGMDENSQQQGQSGGMMGGHGKGKMMGMMQKDSMVATSDGGVVLKSGPRLIKYDKDLNLVKEVELPRPQKRAASAENEAAPQ